VGRTLDGALDAELDGTLDGTLDEPLDGALDGTLDDINHGEPSSGMYCSRYRSRKYF